MQVVIELDEKLVAEIDAVAKILTKIVCNTSMIHCKKFCSRIGGNENTLRQKSAKCIMRVTESFPFNLMSLKLKKNK